MKLKNDLLFAEEGGDAAGGGAPAASSGDLPSYLWEEEQDPGVGGGEEAVEPGGDEPKPAPAGEPKPATEPAPAPGEPQPKVEPAPAAEPAAAAPAPAQQSPQPAQAAAPAAAPAQPAAPAAQPAAPQPGATERAEALKKSREQYRQQLHEAYKLTEDDARALDTEPAEVLPKLAAEMHLRMYESMLYAVQQMVPQLLDGVLQQRQQQEAAEKAFFEKFPQLSTETGKAAVQRIAVPYIQLNPTVDRDTMIREVGTAAMLALGLASGQAQPAPAPAAGAAPSPRPAASAPPTPAPRQQPKLSKEQQFFQEVLDDES